MATKKSQAELLVQRFAGRPGLTVGSGGSRGEPVGIGDADAAELLAQLAQAGFLDNIDEGSREETRLVQEPQESRTAPGDAQHLAYKLFGDHPQLFPNGRFAAARAKGLGALVEAWLGLLSTAEFDQLLTDEERKKVAIARDAGEWWRNQRQTVSNPAAPVPWTADGLEELALDAIANAGSDTQSWLLPIARQAQASGQVTEWQVALIQFFATLRMAEQSGDLDREICTDLMLLCLRRIRNVSPSSSEALRRFLGDLHGMLYFGSGGELPPSVLTSLSAIGDVAGEIRQQPFRRLSIVIYEFTLNFLARGVSDISAAERWQRARIAANNISGHLSSMYGFDSANVTGLGPERRRIISLINRLQVVSVVGTMLEGDDGANPSRAADWQEFGFGLDLTGDAYRDPEDPSVAQDQASSSPLNRASLCLRAMNNVLSGWIYLDADLFQQALGDQWPEDGFLGDGSGLITATFGALLRSRHTQDSDEDADEPVSAFFNAGLLVSRMVRQVHAASSDYDAAEMVLYSLGLNFALQHASRLEEALGELNGGACLVNLLGSATRVFALANRKPVLAEALARTVSAARALLDQNVLQPAQQGRLIGSTKELIQRFSITPRRMRMEEPSDLQAVAEQMLNACIQALELAPATPTSQEWRADFTSSALPIARAVCRLVLAKTLPAEDDPLGATLTRLSRLLRLLVEASHRPPMEVMRELVNVSADGEADATDLHTLVRRTLTQEVPDRTDWRSAFDLLPANHPAPPTHLVSYRSWLDTPGVLSWLPNVQLSS